jgi:hypothetical protein
MTTISSQRNTAFVPFSAFPAATTAQPQPQPTPAAPDSAAQYRASLEQSSFQPSVSGAQAPQAAAPVNSLAVGEPAPVAQQPSDPVSQLKNLSVDEKKAFLESVGVKGKHLKKAKPEEINRAFDQAVDAMVKGDGKFKIKIGGKKYEAKIKTDAKTGEVSVGFKQKKGFFGKLGDTLKKVGKIALTVASFIPGPIGVAARVANAVISAVGAFKKGDILGGIAGMAGAVAGGAGAIAGKATAGVASTVANVAGAVQKGATAASSALQAIKQKNWGNLLGAVAGGASGIAGGLGNAAGSVKDTLNNVATWATRGQTALQAAAAARNGDIIGAIEQGSGLVNEVAPNSRAASIFRDVNDFLAPVRDARQLIGG